MRNAEFIAVVLTAMLAASCTNPHPDFPYVTNNAVVALTRDGKIAVYSFYGLDSSKKQPGVHSKTYRYDVASNTVTEIQAVPDSLGRLAAAASAINNKAYIVGGYAVYPSAKEKSSTHLFAFDPNTETFESLAPLPIAIDDHVQGVWHDSLLYVISGWSDSINVSTVQVYSTAANRWTMATPLPDEVDVKVFGGSGLIVGDTIYVLGGARFEKFYPPSQSFYKGAINPKNPLEITWLPAQQYPGEFRYRSTVWHHAGALYFFGGSHETYNYNGISYAEKKPVEPNQTILKYQIQNGNFSIQPTTYRLMDLRNAAATPQAVYFFGGMLPGQQVSNQILSIHPKP